MMVALVSCAKQKRAAPCAAGELYTSPWFKLARKYVLGAGFDAWYILSAKHGLLDPEQLIEPYDQALADMDRLARVDWANRVYVRARLAIPEGAALTVLAGVAYREFLVPRLVEDGYPVEVPMRGLGIGQQMQWLKERTQAQERRAA